MTEFEQQVAEALEALDRERLAARATQNRHLTVSAFFTPRVAAAITTAYEDGYTQGLADRDAELVDDEPVGPDSASKAALAALRGEEP